MSWREVNPLYWRRRLRQVHQLPRRHPHRKFSAAELCSLRRTAAADDLRVLRNVLDLRDVYWVNEDKHYPITEFTEGRIGFTGRRSVLRVSEGKTLRDVPITFSINKVTGELSLQGVDVPSGYSNECAETKRIL